MYCISNIKSFTVYDIFKVLNRKNLKQRILYLAKLSFRIEGKIEFPRHTKMKGVRDH